MIFLVTFEYRCFSGLGFRRGIIDIASLASGGAYYSYCTLLLVL